MRKVLVILLFLSQPSWARFDLIQSPAGTAASGSCAVTVTALGAHHLLVYCIAGAAASGISAVTATGETFVTATAGVHTGGGDEVDCWHVLNSAGGATSVSGTFGSGTTGCRLFEYSMNNWPAIQNDHQTKTATNSTGLTPALGGTASVIIQMSATLGTITAVTTYTNYNNLTVGNGSADIENTTTTTAPTWTGGASGDADNETAYKESPVKGCFPPYCGVVGSDGL